MKNLNKKNDFKLLLSSPKVRECWGNLPSAFLSLCSGTALRRTPRLPGGPSAATTEALTRTSSRHRTLNSRNQSLSKWKYGGTCFKIQMKWKLKHLTLVYSLTHWSVCIILLSLLKLVPGFQACFVSTVSTYLGPKKTMLRLGPLYFCSGFFFIKRLNRLWCPSGDKIFTLWKSFGTYLQNVRGVLETCEFYSNIKRIS